MKWNAPSIVLVIKAIMELTNKFSPLSQKPPSHLILIQFRRYHSGLLTGYLRIQQQDGGKP
jgi:hypothetical protein